MFKTFARAAAFMAILALSNPAVGQVAKGQPVEVLSQGKWYAATVLETDGARTKIHYEGWTSTWDEWVTAERLRPVQVKTTGRATGEPVADAAPAVGTSSAPASKHKAYCDPFWAEARKDCFLRDRESFSCPIIAANRYQSCLKTGRWS